MTQKNKIVPNNPIKPDMIKTAYRERAKQLAQRHNRIIKSISGEPVLFFFLGENPYAVELKYLAEIQPLKVITPVPKTHRSILGVIDLRGEIYCIMDLVSLLEFETEETGRSMEDDDFNNSGYILILKNNQVGLRIKQIQKIYYVDKKQWTRADQRANELQGNYQKGILAGNRVLLDVEKILEHPVFTSTSL